MKRTSAKILAVIATLTLVSCGDDIATTSSDLDSGSASGPCPDNIDWAYPAISNASKGVYAFAKRNLDTHVGDGECATLNARAVASVGGVRHSQLGPTGNNADYVWGTPIAHLTVGSSSVSGVKPGDLVQYKDAKFRWTQGNRTTTNTSLHHSSIVSAVSRDGRHLCVLQQNSPRGGKVSYGYLKLSGIEQGRLSFYRVKL